jgi:hypothetical protein
VGLDVQARAVDHHVVQQAGHAVTSSLRGVGNARGL